MSLPKDYSGTNVKLCDHERLGDTCLQCFTDDMGRLRTENERLREALERYGRHAEGCSVQSAYSFIRPETCSCGFRAALDGDDDA